MKPLAAILALLLTGCEHFAKLERSYYVSYSHGDSVVKAGATFRPLTQK